MYQLMYHVDIGFSTPDLFYRALSITHTCYINSLDPKCPFNPFVLYGYSAL